MAWAASDRPDVAMAPATRTAPLILLAIAALASVLHDAGAAAYLAMPLWLWRVSASGRLLALGLGTPISRAALGAGALIGSALGTHLLVAASMTLGYRPRVMEAAVARGVAYDLGAQVLATECFFRGALFNRAQRRWSFGAAAALSTVACLGRYLIDPRLPGSAEILCGMVFYITLLSLANCWLFWRFGSLVPGMLSALLFFAAYRMIAE